MARPDPGGCLPPNLRTCGPAPFEEQQRVRLAAWLVEAKWPRGHMGIAELEGYLTALIAWPVGISSGAWLPLIWGERGWKVPGKIEERPQYEEFVALIAGFLQHLDRELSAHPRRFDTSVLRSTQGRGQAGAIHRWGRGVMTALALDGQGLKWRNAAANAAIRTIANRTSPSAPLDSRGIEEVMNAVSALMEQRTSRGPLGLLESAAPLDRAVS